MDLREEVELLERKLMLLRQIDDIQKIIEIPVTLAPYQPYYASYEVNYDPETYRYTSNSG